MSDDTIKILFLAIAGLITGLGGVIVWLVKRKDPVAEHLLPMFQRYLDDSMVAHKEQESHLRSIAADMAEMRGQGGCKYGANS